ASAAAGSAVAGAFGLTTVSKILGWIAIGTGIGAGIAGLFAAKPDFSLIIKNFASTAEKTLPLWQQIASAVSNASAISNSFAQTKDKNKKKKRRAPNKSIDHVAMVFLSVYNSLSIALDKEIATVICRKQNGTLITGPANIGKAHESKTGLCPSGTQEVGDIHTHGAESGPNYDDENFSPDDRIANNNKSLSRGTTNYGYLGTPSGKFIKFIPASIRESPRGRIVVLRR
ncbi:MAG: DUF4329 domain-containing protein, partial [Pyrinomonadaceae bacterium]